MINAPRGRKPVSPRNESQTTPGPLVEARKIPAMGPMSKEKVKPGQYAGSIQRVGKK